MERGFPDRRAEGSGICSGGRLRRVYEVCPAVTVTPTRTLSGEQKRKFIRLGTTYRRWGCDRGFSYGNL